MIPDETASPEEIAIDRCISNSRPFVCVLKKFPFLARNPHVVQSFSQYLNSLAGCKTLSGTMGIKSIAGIQ